MPYHRLLLEREGVSGELQRRMYFDATTASTPWLWQVAHRVFLRIE